MTPGFERPQLKSVMNSARAAFAGLSPARRNHMVWVVAPGVGIQGQLMENLLPGFWTDKLSRIFQGSVGASAPRSPTVGHTENQSNTSASRRGQRTPHVVMVTKAKRLREAGYTYSEIANILGVSRSHAFRLVNS